MPIHYSIQVGIPHCGQGVTEKSVDRETKWRAAPVTVVTKVCNQQVDTTPNTGDVDCAPCLSQMTADGII